MCAAVLLLQACGHGSAGTATRHEEQELDRQWVGHTHTYGFCSKHIPMYQICTNAHKAVGCPASTGWTPASNIVKPVPNQACCLAIAALSSKLAGLKWALPVQFQKHITHCTPWQQGCLPSPVMLLLRLRLQVPTATPYTLGGWHGDKSPSQLQDGITLTNWRLPSFTASCMLTLLLPHTPRAVWQYAYIIGLLWPLVYFGGSLACLGVPLE